MVTLDLTRITINRDINKLVKNRGKTGGSVLTAICTSTARETTSIR